MQLCALHIQDPHESAFSRFSGISHASILPHQVYWITMQLGALYIQDPHESAFSRFSSITAFYHTKSTGLQLGVPLSSTKPQIRGVHRKNEGGFPKDRARSARENFAN